MTTVPFLFNLFHRERCLSVILGGLLVASVVHGMAIWMGAFHPYASLLATVMVLPVAALIFDLRAHLSRCINGWQASVVLMAVTVLIAMTLGSLMTGAGAGGYWKIAERCGTVAIFALACLCRNAQRGLMAYLLVMTVWSVGAVAVAWSMGLGGNHSSSLAALGAGNINWLIAPMAISASMAATWAVALGWRQWRVRPLVYVSAVILVSLTVLQSVSTGRRGAWVALLAGPVVLLTEAAWRRNRVATGVVIVIVVSAMVWWLVVLLPQAGGLARGERLHYMRSAMDCVAESMPFGQGGYAAINVQDSPGEWSRHFTATGIQIASFHNEILDAAAEGGVLALASLAMLAWVVVSALRTIRNVPLRQALLVGCAGCLAVALLDNAWSQAVGALHPAIVVGLAVCAARSTGGMPGLICQLFRMQTVLLAVLSAACAGTLLPAILVTGRTPLIEYAYSTHAVWAPSVLGSQLEAIGAIALQNRDLASLQIAIEADDRVGMSISNPWHHVVVARQANDTTRELSALLRVIRINPFAGVAYVRIHELLVGDPSLASVVPERVRMRSVVSGGQVSGSQRLDKSVANDIDSAADAFIMALSLIAYENRWQDALPLVDMAAERYGDVPQVAQAALRVLIHAEGCDASVLYRHRNRYVQGLRLVDVVELLGEVKRSDQAKRIWPFIASIVNDESASPLGVALRRVKDLAEEANAGNPP